MRFFLFFSLFSLSSWAGPSLRVGDVLLQPLDCWTCSLIEAEEDSIFSHMGIVVSVNPLLVAEAFSRVRAVPLEEFNSKTQKGLKLKVLRIKDTRALRNFKRNAKEFKLLYSVLHDGRSYDRDFLWNNVDEDGNEKLYCSELVTKLLATFSKIEIPVKRMLFEKNRELWERYFKGRVPVGEWGNSPGDFEKSPLFNHVGEI
ncbi:MAG TPA: YiiX/YebB-like N1pC/P60 family cysteine hydrolase [Bacteriovoracaceae bacterium]|nr:YiiX/YebB-like N1pC/P60 family cysteine hydrolase [Bacteriovoracaceae bacterium]